MNLLSELFAASFWGEWLCLSCHLRGEVDETGPTCPECEGQMVSAVGLKLFVDDILAERDEGAEEEG